MDKIINISKSLSMEIIKILDDDPFGLQVTFKHEGVACTAIIRHKKESIEYHEKSEDLAELYGQVDKFSSVVFHSSMEYIRDDYLAEMMFPM